MFVVYFKWIFSLFQVEQAARLKAEKIKIALEKMKEASIKKVCHVGFSIINCIFFPPTLLLPTKRKNNNYLEEIKFKKKEGKKQITF